MAEASIQFLLENLTTLIQGEIGLIRSVDTEMKKLQSTLSTIQAVLEDAEAQQLKSHQIRNWLCKLNDLIYEIDDILDECSTKAAKMKYNNGKYYLYNPKYILHRRKIGKRMEEVNEKLNIVAEERSKFHLREIVIEKQSKVITTRETGSVLNYSEPVYGRNEEKDKIVDILVNQVRERQELSILPIVGIGGLGKTTLAQLVFNDPRVAEHFSTKIWVCVSDNFDIKTLVKAMIESVTGSGSASNLERLDTLKRSLHELLNQKRYLLVLDDVWNEDQNLWFDLKNVLACGSSGASIILTTRIRKIADMMSTIPTQALTGLSIEHCWLLFKQRAFGQEEKQYPNLEEIGKHIVNKCVGVPLAAKTLGGLLRFKRKEKEWLNVKESEIWNLPQEETSILPALRLSYHHLPLNLRQCFAYCGVFRKDYEMEKEELIRLWIAHGYISSNQTSEVEDVGDDIWNELVLRSFFQEVSIQDTVTTFKMHDLVHDLAQSILKNKVPGAQAESNTVGACKNKIREVNMRIFSMAFPTKSLPDMDSFSVIKEFSSLRSMHSMEFPTISLPYMDLTSVIKEFSNLRILVAREEVSHLPSKIGNLHHLRYLNLSGANLRTLPNAICKLWNLMILNLNGCKYIMRLPKHMRRMRNLRHVYLEGCDSLSEMPPKIGELTFLRTWCVFIVGHEKGSHLEELESLNNLGGTLTIKHLERVKRHIHAKKANLTEKKNLRVLRLEWEEAIPAKSGETKDDKILEALEPHPNLEELYITGFKGKQFPHWMENSALENIVLLDIRGCPNCLHLPLGLGDLPRLKRLELWDLGYMEYIVESDVAVLGANSVLKPKFPSLEDFILIDLPNLKGLFKEETGYFFPNLHFLSVRDCFSLKIPHLPSLKELALVNCSSMNLASISKLHNLETLSAWYCEEDVVDFPFENLHNLTSLRFDSLTKLKCLGEGLQFLTSLQHLTLRWLPELTSLPDGLEKCISLSKLGIHNCPKLESFPDCIKQLRNLKSLKITNCPELDKWCEKKKGEDEYQGLVQLPQDGKYLPNLTHLRFEGLDKMKCIPEALQVQTSLEKLSLQRLPELNSLPDGLCKCTSLSSLYIYDCPKLELFPDSIKQLRNLETLEISNCPELEKWCEKKKGEEGDDWYKIVSIMNW